MRLRENAERIAEAIGPVRGLRILHVTDFHNRLRGFRLVRRLAGVLRPDLVVNTGDISGLGSLAESFFIRGFCRLEVPTVFAPGNHESARAVKHFKAVGACCLEEPGVCEEGGVRVWGYADPNSTRLFERHPYSSALCAKAMDRYWPPPGQRPLIAAVHHAAMAGSPAAGIPLVLCGHVHTPKVVRRGGTLYVRPGSSGGGGPFGGALDLAVIDVDSTSYEPQALWLARVVQGEPVVQSHPLD